MKNIFKKENIIYYAILGILLVVMIAVSQNKVLDENYEYIETNEEINLEDIKKGELTDIDKMKYPSVDQGEKGTNKELIQSFIQALKMKDYDSVFMMFNTKYTDSLYKDYKDYIKLTRNIGNQLTRENKLNAAYIKDIKENEYTIILAYSDRQQATITLQLGDYIFEMNPMELVKQVKDSLEEIERR